MKHTNKRNNNIDAIADEAIATVAEINEVVADEVVVIEAVTDETVAVDTVIEEEIVLTLDQIQEIINRVDILKVGIESGGSHANILGAMAEIAKLHRRISKPASEAIVTIREDGTKLIGATTVIKCEECGVDHIVKVQDVHQVKRCPACQKTYRNAKRAEKRKEKRADVKATKEADKAIAEQLLAEYKAKQAQEQA